ncbi:hypothetical protein T484DRAFT_1935858 [Baffinella frigidus]|nr:hypothetical protein T484DRAFT_1935858 [Cryptophyta sp. CCMP2293]
MRPPTSAASRILLRWTAALAKPSEPFRGLLRMRPVAPELTAETSGRRSHGALVMTVLRGDIRDCLRDVVELSSPPPRSPPPRNSPLKNAMWISRSIQLTTISNNVRYTTSSCTSPLSGSSPWLARGCFPWNPSRM